jgi:hypothetical protein
VLRILGERRREEQLLEWRSAKRITLARSINQRVTAQQQTNDQSDSEHTTKRHGPVSCALHLSLPVGLCCSLEDLANPILIRLFEESIRLIDDKEPQVFQSEAFRLVQVIHQTARSAQQDVDLGLGQTI